MHHKREKENRSSFLLSRDQQKCPWMIEKGIKATYENTLILQVACLDCEKLVQLSKSQWGGRWGGILTSAITVPL